MSAPVYIVATGARTPLGLKAAPSAAALRAGIGAVVEHPLLLDHLGDQVVGGLDSELDPALMGPERLVALGETALREVCASIPKNGAGLLPPLPLFLCLAEIRPGFGERDVRRVQQALQQTEGLPLTFSELIVCPQGHAAGLAAFRTAIEQIQKRECEAFLVAGVDSYFHPHTVAWLDKNRQLAGADARSAFVPGEGAGCCLLVSEKAQQQLGLRVLARVIEGSTAKETKLIKTPDICLGEGLTTAVTLAVRSLRLPDEKINEVICDINGERYRAEEWGFVCLRLPQYFDDPTAYLSPADCWGDIGAASVPLFAILACEAAIRGYAKGNRVMLWASSEKGLRGAAVLETTSNS